MSTMASLPSTRRNSTIFGSFFDAPFSASLCARCSCSSTLAMHEVRNEGARAAVSAARLASGSGGRLLTARCRCSKSSTDADSTH